MCYPPLRVELLMFFWECQNKLQQQQSVIYMAVFTQMTVSHTKISTIYCLPAFQTKTKWYVTSNRVSCSDWSIFADKSVTDGCNQQQSSSFLCLHHNNCDQRIPSAVSFGDISLCTSERWQVQCATFEKERVALITMKKHLSLPSVETFWEANFRPPLALPLRCPFNHTS